VVALNATDLEIFRDAGIDGVVLPTPVPPDRVSTLDKKTARERLDLPLDSPVYLHLGHATCKRNLRVLEPLADSGILLLVISPHSVPEDGALPTGRRVEVVRGRVDVGDYYRAADVYVFPTVEGGAAIGLPMSIAEALGNGLHVVARRSRMTERWAEDPRVVLVDDDDDLIIRARERAAAASA
jgi:glycosyltransferase involved in cell wall biosynthesis